MIISKWPTIVSHVDNLFLTKLVYDGTLVIHMNSVEGGKVQEVTISFGERPIFRDTQEEYTIRLGAFLASLPEKIGRTFILEKSDWLVDLNKDDLFPILTEGAKHYVVCMEDDIVEVVTSNEPSITLNRP